MTSGLFWMFFAREAYSSVDSVSSMLEEEGETVAMMEVLVRPPSASWSSRVSFDSLKGYVKETSRKGNKYLQESLQRRLCARKLRIFIRISGTYKPNGIIFGLKSVEKW